MAQNALRGNFSGEAAQFRITPGLDVVNSQNSFVKW
jgi:hypothetical protein